MENAYNVKNKRFLSLSIYRFNETIARQKIIRTLQWSKIRHKIWPESMFDII